MAEDPIVLSPVPGPTERPFLRIGNRRYLKPIPFPNDAALFANAPFSENEFGWSETTGRVVLSEADVAKGTPGQATYDVAYLGAQVYFDGVALCREPVPVRSPAPLRRDVDISDPDGIPINGSDDDHTIPLVGDVYMPLAVQLPFPGRSGVLFEPDGTGKVPTATALDDALTRPNGCGLVRRIRGIGDSFMFAVSTGSDGTYAFANTDVEEYAPDLRDFSFRVPKTDFQVARIASDDDRTSNGIVLSPTKFRRRGITDSAAYFTQVQVYPSAYGAADSSGNLRMWSRITGPYTVGADDRIRFGNASVAYDWSSSALGAGTYTASEIADALNVVLAPSGMVAGHFRDRLYVETTGDAFEVGWNEDPLTGDTDEDVSGHAALGFLPGWRLDGSDFVWLPDNGSCFGMLRSPENVNAKGPAPDLRAIQTVDQVFTDSVPAVPFVTLSVFPLEDVPGYDVDVHFRVSQGLKIVDLKNYRGVFYDFDNDRFAWTDTVGVSPTALPFPTTALPLAATLALADTVSSEAMEPVGDGFGLYLREPTSTSTFELVLGEDFLLPANGAPGQATLVTVIGGMDAFGAAAYFTSGGTTFRDLNVPDWTATTVEPGYLLRILNGDAEGVYTVTSVFAAELVVDPPFPASANAILGYAQWRIYEGLTRDVYDPAVLADVILDPFNHFPSEPFVIRVLSPLGDVSTDPITAPVATAVDSGRVFSVRFTPQDSLEYVAANEAQPTLLRRGVSIGAYSQTGLFVPDLSDPHFSLSSGLAAYFSIRVGATVYSTEAGNLTIVAAGTSPAGDVLEVVESTGALLFGDAVDGTAQSVFYDQVFLDPSDIPTGTFEVDVGAGTIRLSAGDATREVGNRVYLVEQMITEGNRDVFIAPLTGSILFNTPLRNGQVVETAYTVADSSGDKLIESGSPVEVTEYLPITVRLEPATRVDATTYTFNPMGRTVAEEVEPFIWVGVELQNYGGVTTATITGSTIEFIDPVDESDTVQINYGVYEAFGGETAYTVSTPPVYRKPFWLDAEQDTYTLETDRTADLLPGALFFLAELPLYIKSSTYDASTDTTEVVFWPPPHVEAGSKAPGGDVAVSVSTIPVAISVDGVATGGYEGFLLDYPDAVYLPVDRNDLSITFYGNWTEVVSAGHLLELGGYPFRIAGATLTPDGRYTQITVSTPFSRSFSHTEDGVRVSPRPVYYTGTTAVGTGSPFVDTEEFEVFLMRDKAGLPGRVLTSGVHFTADPANGRVTFLLPTMERLTGGQRVLFRHTRLDTVAPIIADDAQINPVYSTKHVCVTTPTLDNGLLSSTLAARYSYRSPDSFYCRTVPIEGYIPEVAGIALQKVSVGSASGGPVLAFPGTPINYKEGSFGVRGRVADLLDQDRAARNFLEVYNAIVVAFEQVLETIDGRIIGDRDGKFRLFVGHGKVYAPKGYEDVFTGRLNKRNIWRLLIEEWSDDLADGYFRERDGIFSPNTYFEGVPAIREGSQDDRPGEVDGDTVSGKEIDLYIARQSGRIKNDMDDRVLVGLRRGTLFAQVFPWMEVKGRFRDMWEAHALSRLFPERTLAFDRLYPGVEADLTREDPGYYTAGKTIETPGPEPGETTDTVLSTRNTKIGTVSNPVFTEGVPNITDILVRDRYQRARVWAYYPEGSPELDAALVVAGLSGSTSGSATFVVTPLPLVDFPIDPNTGFPDFAQLVSQGGGLADASSGDFDLATPGFAPGNRLLLGYPNGRTFDLYGPDAAFAFSRPSIFVQEVIAGCVILVASGDNITSPIPGSSIFRYKNGGSYVTPEIERGDTLFCGTPANAADISDPETDEPTLEDLAIATQALPDYRVQYDLGVKNREGEFIDKTLSRGWANDERFPFDLQSLLIQKPPEPLDTIEADVSFVNTETSPVQIPALLGQARNDSGDVSIPYMRSRNTELDALAEASAGVRGLFDSDVLGTLLPAPLAGPPAVVGLSTDVAAGTDEFQQWRAEYPDELPGRTTQMLPAQDGTLDPDTLYVSANLDPVPTTGDYVDRSGVGSIRPYDLLLVEAGQPLTSSGELPQRFTGLLSVGAMREAPGGGFTSSLEVPRFVTPTALGETHRYYAGNVWGHVEGNDDPGSAGSVVSETVPGNYITTLDMSSVGGVVFDDGGGVGTGGLHDILNPGGNAIRIDFYEQSNTFVGDPHVGSIYITDVTAGTTAVFSKVIATGVVTAHQLVGVTPFQILNGVSGGTGNSFVLETTAASGSVLTTAGLTPSETYDFTVTVDTYIEADTAADTGLGGGTGTGSTTAQIDRDRLTFTEGYSFYSALPRDTHPANEAIVQLGLELDVRVSPVTQVGGGTVGSDVNACAYQTASGGVNGGSWATPLRLTFKERVGPSPDGTRLPGEAYVGTWDTATLRGRVRAMSWEYGNVGLTFPSGTDPVDNIRLSVASSSDTQVDPADPGVSDSLILVLEDNTPSGGIEAWIRDSGDITLVKDDTGATADFWSPRPWIEGGAASAGALSNVQAGDIALVSGATAGDGSPKAGTYLVRHAIPWDGTTVSTMANTPIVESKATVTVLEEGWLDVRLPSIRSFEVTRDGSSAITDIEVTLKGVPPVPFEFSGSGCGFESIGTTARYIYLILDVRYATYDSAGPTYTLNDDSVYSIRYDAVAYNPDTEQATFTIRIGTGRKADGSALTDEDFAAALAIGRQVSGMTVLPIRTDKIAEGFPANNLVGNWEHSGATTAIAGFHYVAAGNRLIRDSNPAATPATQPAPVITWDVTGADEELVYQNPHQETDGISPADAMVVVCPEPRDSTEFYEEKTTPIYALDDGASTPGSPTTTQARGVATHVVLNRFQITSSVSWLWNKLHFDPGAAVPPNALTCILPGDVFTLGDAVDVGSANPGHVALSGVFFEPSFPLSTDTQLALFSPFPRVVSQGHPLNDTLVGIIGSRSAADHGFATPYAPVSCIVRRIRRFHEVTSDIASDLSPLRYTYRIRRGETDPGSPPLSGDLEFTAYTGGSYPDGTNLGPLDDPDVNVNAGDMLRVIDGFGNVLDTAEIKKVVDGTTLKLRRPGLTASTATLSAATGFEVYLEQHPVPHEQSHEQLLSLLTDEVVHTTRVSYSSGDTTGGRVDDFNQLSDDGSDPYTPSDVLEGDYIIIDPAGPLYKQGENGVRPIGDQSVEDRTDGSYDSGGPSAYDDNRGFYRVESVEAGYVQVTGASRFGGGDPSGSDDVILGGTDAAYADLPTVHDSDLTASAGPFPYSNREGQQSLRPTAGAVDDGSGTLSYASRTGYDASSSIGPFGYRIIRTSPIFSQDATELVLHMRVRFLSWLEVVETSYDKGGDYYVFQRDDHIDNLPDGTDPTSGPGILTNPDLTTLVGLTEYAPYAGASDRLSLLGRRFDVLDTRLDSEAPPGASPPPAYTTFTSDGVQRPVLFDNVEDALDTGDRFREQRFSWIAFRADREDGSIVTARREQGRLPSRIRKERELADQRKTFDDS